MMKLIKNFIVKYFALVFMLMLTAQLPLAAQDVKVAAPKMSSEAFWMLMMMGLVLFVAILVLLTTLYVVIVMRQLYAQELAKKGIVQVSLWDQLMQQMNRFTPIEEEKNILLDHDYDGIKELDNHLPPWWVYLFYGTIGYAVVYLFAYHIVGGLIPTPQDEYKTSVETAAIEVAAYRKTMAENIDETNAKFLKDDKTALAAGQSVFEKNCVPCHGKNLEGGTGPNLTDEYWLHGGDVKEVFKTIKYGVPEKGMISWEKKLKPDEIQQVASYILSKQGSKPGNAKAPQGEKYVKKSDKSEKES